MTAEEYLQQIRLIDAIIINREKDSKHWREKADGIGSLSISERVQSSRNLQRGADAIIEYISIDNEIEALKRKRQAIIKTIESLPIYEYKILYAIYVDGYMVKELPSMFDKSLDWAKKMKRKALDHVQQIIDKKEG